MDSKKKVVIIGGGTAGLTIANNLQDYFDVVVIEKSQYKKYPERYRPPLLIGLLFRSKKLRYMSKRDFVMPDGRRIPFFESNVFGGASVINGCVHMLGSKTRWAAILKKFDSNYDELIDSYQKIYSFNSKIKIKIKIKSKSKSKSKIKIKNKINLSPSYQNIIDKAFIKTLNLFGIPKGDTNYSNIESCGPIFNTVRGYFRTSVISLINKNGFKFHIKERVEGLLFNDSQVVGVKTNLRKINSDYVILSGGVIGTCSLLLRESIRIERKGNDILRGLAFGKDIQDHTNLRVNVLTNKNTGSLNEISNSFYQKSILLVKHFAGKSTLMKGTGASSAVHLDLDKDGEIDTRIQVVQFSETGRHGSDGKFFSSSQPGFSLSITAINPKSKGRITLDGSNNIVDPMFLSSKKDIELLKLALEFCLKLLKSSPINKHVLKIEDEESIEHNPEKYIINNIFSGHHLIGGVHNAINSDFEVNNTKGLYVCDASIFERYTASNIHSSVILIADIFSNKFIVKNKGGAGARF
jgi:choline dehydrogenase-like flavoprotein